MIIDTDSANKTQVVRSIESECFLSFTNYFNCKVLYKDKYTLGQSIINFKEWLD